VLGAAIVWIPAIAIAARAARVVKDFIVMRMNKDVLGLGGEAWMIGEWLIGERLIGERLIGERLIGERLWQSFVSVFVSEGRGERERRIWVEASIYTSGNFPYPLCGIIPDFIPNNNSHN